VSSSSALSTLLSLRVILRATFGAATARPPLFTFSVVVAAVVALLVLASVVAMEDCGDGADNGVGNTSPFQQPNHSSSILQTNCSTRLSNAKRS
jgi:hypothetical protein